MKRIAPSLLLAYLALTACSSTPTSEHKEMDRDPAANTQQKKTGDAALQRASGKIKKISSGSTEPGFTPPLAAPAAETHALAAPAQMPQAPADSHTPANDHVAAPQTHAPQAHDVEAKKLDAKAHADANHGHGHAAAATANSASGAHATAAKPQSGENLSDRSVRWLQNGNTRYVTRRFRADGRQPADRERTKATQKPHAIVLSCSDSRVPPELVFDQGIGEIFVIRVAGEALDATSLASIEYAVEHLNPNLIVVLGHTKCEAVDAAMKIKEGTSAGSEHLDRLLSEIRPHLKTRSTEQPSPNLEIESALNADGVARDLVKRSEIVRHKVEQGTLKIKSALYWIDTGKVKFY